MNEHEYMDFGQRLEALEVWLAQSFSCFMVVLELPGEGSDIELEGQM